MPDRRYRRKNGNQQEQVRKEQFHDLQLFPGCTLKNKAKDLDHYARECAKVLGFELEEIENWQCCGAVYPQASDEIATKLSSVRALADAKEKGQDLITVCSACHHVIKRVNDDMANVEDIQTKVNNYMALSEPYLGETKVLHYLEVLRDVVGFDKIKEKVVNPLKGRKIGAYYGCMLLRPSTTMQFDDPENPTIIEDFIKALGATPVVYPMRNECCGGYISLKEKENGIQHGRPDHGIRILQRSRRTDHCMSALHVQPAQ